MARPLSEQELEEIENLAAECDLKPERRRIYFAELIRLREFARCAGRFRNRLPLKVQQSLERNIPRGADLPLLVEQAIEGQIEEGLHHP
jgi:hypothetical protein